MSNELKNLIHGRETYIADFGPDFVMKRPLPTLGDTARDQWLAKQHRTKEIIDEINEEGFIGDHGEGMYTLKKIY